MQPQSILLASTKCTHHFASPGKMEALFVMSRKWSARERGPCEAFSAHGIKRYSKCAIAAQRRPAGAIR
nr:MAG TPA: hypothetical protein [Bacteriophage sp.]